MQLGPFSTGTTLGKGIAEAYPGNKRYMQDYERIRDFINTQTSFRVVQGSATRHELRLKAVGRCSSRQ